MSRGFIGAEVVKAMKSSSAAGITLDLPLLWRSSYEAIYGVLYDDTDKER